MLISTLSTVSPFLQCVAINTKSVVTFFICNCCTLRQIFSGNSVKLPVLSFILHDKTLIRKGKSIFMSYKMFRLIYFPTLEKDACLQNQHWKVSSTLNLMSFPSIMTCVLAAF